MINLATFIYMLVKFSSLSRETRRLNIRTGVRSAEMERYLILTSILIKWQRDSPMEVGISRKSMVGFEGLLTHNNFGNFFRPQVDLDKDPWRWFLCHLLRLDVKKDKKRPLFETNSSISSIGMKKQSVLIYQAENWT